MRYLILTLQHLWLALKVAIPLYVIMIAMAYAAKWLMVLCFGMTGRVPIFLPVSVGMLGFVPLLAIITAVHHWRLGKHRGVSRDEFVAAFADANVPAEISGAVYDFYKEQTFSGDFSVAPDDDYDLVLSAREAEIDEDGEFLMKALDLKMPPDNAMESSQWQIRTLRDMVLWLNWVRQNQPG
jgi:hypothetical protein